MISTRSLSLIPPSDALKRLSQSLALLDAILMPDWGLRYYSFDAHWTTGAYMASMRTGLGDEYFVLFDSRGTAVKGFAHEAPMSPYRTKPPTVWPGVLDQVPHTFADFLHEPAFTITDATFCIWRTAKDDAWQRGDIDFPPGPDPDGSADLLRLWDGVPTSYQNWAEEYYEQPVDLAAVTHIYQHLPLTSEIVRALNREMTLEASAEYVQQIGYPTRSSR
jgi:hypothetical protein